MIVNKQKRVELSPAVSMPFQYIPAGEFRMGSRGERHWEEPRHSVEITEPIYFGTHPVTQEEFGVWTSETGAKHENEFPGRLTHPTENVTWNQAVEFCDWLNSSRSEQLLDNCRAMLPTEAQWEYACRGGTDTEYHTGDGGAALSEAGWFGEEWGSGSTHPVGQKTANSFGLHDMHGNVWEWCRDALDADAYKKRVDGVVNPVVLSKSDRILDVESAMYVESDNPDRVFRGGSWIGAAWDCRSAYRIGDRPGYRFDALGFRVCLFPGLSAETQ